MDMKRIGLFLKQLRKEKELTQEQLAEMFDVSRRTVSRWENGNNIPDLDLLLELADFYEIDLREILDGERKSSKSIRYDDDTIKKVIDLSQNQKEKIRKRMHLLCIIGLVIGVINTILFFTNNTHHFIGGVCQGAMLGYMIVGCIMTSKYAIKIHLFKMKLLN